MIVNFKVELDKNDAETLLAIIKKVEKGKSFNPIELDFKERFLRRLAYKGWLQYSYGNFSFTEEGYNLAKLLESLLPFENFDYET